MEIKEQDIFANASEEVLPTEPSPVADTSKPEPESVPAENPMPVVEESANEPEEEPFELKVEEPKVRKKQTPKPIPVVPKLEETKVEEPTSEPNLVQTIAEQPEAKVEEKPEPKQEEKPKKPKRSSITWQLFKTFFKIGIVTFGGGYAMIPMIESEVVDKKKWVEKEQFLDLIAIAQTCPGVFAINISTFIGYKLKHNFGACMAALGAALPSFIIILLIATMFSQIQDVPWVAACFRGIRPAVVALIAVPTFNLAKSAKINLSTCWIPILSAVLIWKLGVNPVFIIIAAALGGYLYGTLIKEK